MKKNRDRLKHFGATKSPTPDEYGYEVVRQYHLERLEKNPEIKKQIEKNQKKAFSICATQERNSIGFLQDKELRYFHSEFNSRVWNFGFGSMPAAFNVLEGFFKWNPKLFFFELFEEEEYLFSLFDFFDFTTSKNSSNSLDYFIEDVEDNLIHNYNIINDIKDLTFSTEDSKEYVLGGVSFVKRDNELFMLIVGGEIGDTKEISKSIPDYKDIEQLNEAKRRTYIKPAENRKEEAVKLLGREDIWKVNIYLRIDLESKTIDSRYIQKDVGNRFHTITDDYGMFEKSIQDQTTLEEVVEIQAKEIKTYDAIFEAAYNFLFLPEYFNFYNDAILSEEHPTNLSEESLRKPKFKKQLKFDSKYFSKVKDVWVLDRKIDPISGNIKLKHTELKIEKDGYWQYLEPGKLGKDKMGKPIHSRTWVEKTLTWHESTFKPQTEVVISPKYHEDKKLKKIEEEISKILKLVSFGMTNSSVIDYPNVFTLRPKEIHKSSESNFKTTYELQLFCSHKECVHPVGKAYEIDIPKEWIKKISPYVNNLIKGLKMVAPLISPIAYATLGSDDFTPQKYNLKATQEYLNKLELIGTSTNLRAYEQRPATEAEMQVIKQILDSKDSNKSWMTYLEKVTSDGEVLWVCPKHGKEYM